MPKTSSSTGPALAAMTLNLGAHAQLSPSEGVPCPDQAYVLGPSIGADPSLVRLAPGWAPAKSPPRGPQDIEKLPVVPVKKRVHRQVQ